MIVVIRIHGRVKINKKIEETLSRLRMKRKLHAVLIDEKDEIRMGMIKSVRDFIAYGEITGEIEKKLKEKRGEKDKDGKDRGFFRLHPPRGGFKKSTKQSFPKGILGEKGGARAR